MDFKEMKQDGVYDYIANHYYEMSRDELKDLALEMIWQLEQSNGNYDIACQKTIETLAGE